MREPYIRAGSAANRPITDRFVDRPLRRCFYRIGLSSRRCCTRFTKRQQAAGSAILEQSAAVVIVH
ncbi:hypothetical protein D3C84_654220 [compost metagenome]